MAKQNFWDYMELYHKPKASPEPPSKKKQASFKINGHTLSIIARHLNTLGVKAHCNDGKASLCKAILALEGKPFTTIEQYGMKNILGSFYKTIPSVPHKRPNKTTRPAKYSYQENKTFYESDEWRSLRYKVIKFYGRKCMVCGAVPHPENKVRIHVDHIKPRSKFPELELSFENLQVLCEDCNLGKSNKDCIDYRNQHSKTE